MVVFFHFEISNSKSCPPPLHLPFPFILVVFSLTLETTISSFQPEKISGSLYFPSGGGKFPSSVVSVSLVPSPVSPLPLPEPPPASFAISVLSSALQLTKATKDKKHNKIVIFLVVSY